MRSRRGDRCGALGVARGVALALAVVAAAGCRPRPPGLPDEDDAPRPPGTPPRPTVVAPGALRVWAVPEGVRVRPDATVAQCGGPSPFVARFPDYRNRNPVWDAAARRIRLEAARGESVSVHVLVDAVGAPLIPRVSASLPTVLVTVSLESLIRVARRSANEYGPIPGVCEPGDVPDILTPIPTGECRLASRLGAVAPSPRNGGAGAVFAAGTYTGKENRNYVVEMMSTNAFRVSADGGRTFGAERRVRDEAHDIVLLQGEGLDGLSFQRPTRKVDAGPAFVKGDRFRFEAYEEFTQGFYLEVAVPRDAPVGTLRGHVVVEAQGMEPARLDLEVDVKGVTLPPAPTLDMVWRLYPDDIAIAHGLEGATPEARFETVRDYVRMARLHGAEVIVRGVDPEEDPALFDRTYGTLLTGAAFADGRPARFFEIQADPPAADPAAEEKFVARLRAAAAHLHRLGHKGRILVYPVDEPSLCDYGRVARLAGLVAKAGGERLTLLMTAHPFPIDPVDSQHGRAARKRCGPELGRQIAAAAPKLPVIWAMPAQYYFPAASNPGSRWAIDSVRPAGRAWFYQDHEPWVGGVRLDAEAIGPRTWGWIAHRYKPDGVFYYAATHWETASHGHRNPRAIAQVALTYRGRQSAYNGDGALFYPAPGLGAEGPVASLRMKAFRRGSQDHALLTMLAQRDPAAAERHAAALVPQALNVFEPGADHAAPTWRKKPGRGAWSHDPVAYDEAASAIRAALAATPDHGQGEGAGTSRPAPNPGAGAAGQR
ncbi:MAG: DUF4091 domain-containing protein [Deltaproteobacteria bacterium]|nr:DUF4091 domain-containing protein [Deltaproteobacteria bacterium]